MKKVFATGIMAICLIALSQQQASAWINARFGVGLNWAWQSGGNTIGWGAWRGAQPPGPEVYSSQHYHNYGMPQFSAPMPAPHGAVQTSEPPAYATPSVVYPAPFQFATYPRPIYYYYPTPYYDGR